MKITAKEEATNLVNRYNTSVGNIAEGFIERSLQLDNAKKEAVKIAKENIELSDTVSEYDFWVKVKKEVEML